MELCGRPGKDWGQRGERRLYTMRLTVVWIIIIQHSLPSNERQQGSAPGFTARMGSWRPSRLERLALFVDGYLH